MTTLSEVAKRAGVSVSTVSRYTKGQLKLSSQTERRVLEAMAASGYQPPLREATDRVGLIIPDLANPYFAALAETVALVGASLGQHVLISVSGGNAAREATLVGDYAEMESLAGIFYVGMNPRNPALATQSQLPIVILDERVELEADAAIPFVGADNFAGAVQATNFLLSQGHRRIAHVAGPPELHSSQERIKGYRSALQGAGVEFEEELIFSGPYSERFGANVLTYTTQLRPRPTALFVASDIVAVGVLSAAELNGIQVPGSLSVVGFDGIRLGHWLRLTTVRQPIDDIVREGYAQLTALVQGRPTRSIELPMELEIRDTVQRLDVGSASRTGAAVG